MRYCIDEILFTVYSEYVKREIGMFFQLEKEMRYLIMKYASFIITRFQLLLAFFFYSYRLQSKSVHQIVKGFVHLFGFLTSSTNASGIYKVW
jgi:hypothetical protein